MSTHQDLQREVELTRQQLSETVDALVHKMDVKQRVRPLVKTLREYRVPLGLLVLTLVVALWPRRQ